MDKLISLQQKLEKLNLKAEAKQIELLRLSFMGPSPLDVERMKSMTTPEQTLESTHALLDMLGIVPGYGEIADLANAALYLSTESGVKSYFNAGISIVSMISGFGDAAKILRYVKMVDKSGQMKHMLPIAQRILNNEGTIGAIFTRLRSAEVKKRLGDIPHGELLAKYSPQMFEIIIKWARELVSSVTEKGLDTMIEEGL